MQGDSGAQMTPEAQEQQQEAQREQEERRQSMLAQVLQPQARERCEPHSPHNRLAACSSLRETLSSLMWNPDWNNVPGVAFSAKDACCAVARIALVKPEKARGVENLVLQMAQRAQITEKVSA